jgi:hypothetical protein
MLLPRTHVYMSKQLYISPLFYVLGLWGLVNNAGLQVISAPLELQSKLAIEKQHHWSRLQFFLYCDVVMAETL